MASLRSIFSNVKRVGISFRRVSAHPPISSDNSGTAHLTEDYYFRPDGQEFACASFLGVLRRKLLPLGHPSLTDWSTYFSVATNYKFVTTI